MGRGVDGQVDLGDYAAELNLKALGKLYLTGFLVSVPGSCSVTLTF